MPNNVVIVKDVKATTANGGSSIAGTQQRVLNTVEGNSSLVSLSGNQFTLQKGTYNIVVTAPAYYINTHQAILENVTDAINYAGTSERSGTSGINDSAASHSIVTASFTIDSAKTFEVNHYTQLAQATNGLGTASGSGQPETYTTVKITKTDLIPTNIIIPILEKTGVEKRLPGNWFGCPQYEKSYNATYDNGDTIDSTLNTTDITPRNDWIMDGVLFARYSFFLNATNNASIKIDGTKLYAVTGGTSYKVVSPTLQYTKNAECP
jgi:hypothetical protein